MKNKDIKSKSKIDWDVIKEQIKKRFKKFLNRLKKFFIRIWNQIKKIAIQLKDKFMELPKKIRLIIYVWALVVVSLLFFIFATSASKKFYEKYSTYEQNINAAALKYVKAKGIYATVDNKLKIDLNVLQEENYVSPADIADETCEGISVVYYDDDKAEYIIDSYLNCKRYTSKYYWDYK
jgi:hypothetical protein